MNYQQSHFYVWFMFEYSNKCMGLFVARLCAACVLYLSVWVCVIHAYNRFCFAHSWWAQMKNSANNSSTFIWDIQLFSIYKTVSVENLTSRHSHTTSATAEDERAAEDIISKVYTHSQSQIVLKNINHIDTVFFYSSLHCCCCCLLSIRELFHHIYFFLFNFLLCHFTVRFNFDVCNVLTFILISY